MENISVLDIPGLSHEVSGPYNPAFARRWYYLALKGCTVERLGSRTLFLHSSYYDLEMFMQPSEGRTPTVWGQIPARLSLYLLDGIAARAPPGAPSRLRGRTSLFDGQSPVSLSDTWLYLKLGRDCSCSAAASLTVSCMRWSDLCRAFLC